MKLGEEEGRKQTRSHSNWGELKRIEGMKLGEEEKKTNQKPLKLGRVAFYAIRNANAS